MASTGIMEQVRTLLAQGMSSREVIGLGYKSSTVYKKQRQMAQEGVVYRPPPENPQANNHEPPQPSTVRLPHRIETPDPEVEADPEIRKLKVQLRRAELQRKIAELEGPAEQLESRVAALEAGMGEIITEFRALEPYVFGNPVANLRDEFRCPCGAEDQVAAKVVCTACSAETDYSWWSRLS